MHFRQTKNNPRRSEMQDEKVNKGDGKPVGKSKHTLTIKRQYQQCLTYGSRKFGVKRKF